MAYNIIIEDARNRWIFPNSTEHKILAMAAKYDISEAGVCKALNRQQGFYYQTMFDFMAMYELNSGNGSRHATQLIERGFKVLELLDSGVAVNIRDLTVSKERAEAFADRSIRKQANIKYKSHKYAIMKALYEHGRMGVAEFQDYMDFSNIDNIRYAKSLAGFELLTLEKIKGRYYVELTDFGVNFYEVEILGELQNDEIIEEAKLLKAKIKSFKNINSYRCRGKVIGDTYQYEKLKKILETYKVKFDVNESLFKTLRKNFEVFNENIPAEVNNIFETKVKMNQENSAIEYFIESIDFLNKVGFDITLTEEQTQACVLAKLAA